MPNLNVEYKDVVGCFQEKEGKKTVKLSEVSKKIEGFLGKKDLWKEYDNLRDLRSKLSHLNFSTVDKNKIKQLKEQQKDLLIKINNAINNTRYLKKEGITECELSLVQKWSVKQKRVLQYNKTVKILRSETSRVLETCLRSYFSNGDDNPYKNGSKSLPKLHKIRQEYNKARLKELEEMYRPHVVKKAMRMLSKNTQDMTRKGFQLFSPSIFEALEQRCQKVTADAYGMPEKDVREIIAYGKEKGLKNGFQQIATTYIQAWQTEMKTVYGEEIFESALNQKVQQTKQGYHQVTPALAKEIEEACIEAKANEMKVDKEEVKETRERMKAQGNFLITKSLIEDFKNYDQLVEKYGEETVLRALSNYESLHAGKPPKVEWKKIQELCDIRVQLQQQEKLRQQENIVQMVFQAMGRKYPQQKKEEITNKVAAWLQELKIDLAQVWLGEYLLTEEEKSDIFNKLQELKGPSLEELAGYDADTDMPPSTHLEGDGEGGDDGGRQ